MENGCTWPNGLSFYLQLELHQFVDDESLDKKKKHFEF